MTCEHKRQTYEEAGQMPCAAPGCIDGADGRQLRVFKEDGATEGFRRILQDGVWMWARITGGAAAVGVTR